MNKKNSKIFKDRWHQFQEKVNFEGRKDKFSKIIKNKGSHFSKKISNFKFKVSNFKFQRRKKKLFQRTTKINQGFRSKRGNSNQREEREEDHTSK